MKNNTCLSTKPSWSEAAELLDQTFPLTSGSHHDVSAYLVYFEHLLAIQTDGTSTGLARPVQFIEAQGGHDNPLCIVLKHNNLQVEIEPVCRHSNTAHSVVEHRMSLTTVSAVA